MGILSLPVHEVLPVELILAVADVLFATADGFLDVVRLSMVNTIIRDIVVSCPKYWTSITLDMKTSSVTLAQLCIQRSQEHPVSLDVVLVTGSDPTHMTDIIRVLVISTPRLKALTLRLTTFSAIRTLGAVLSSLTMPMLESLVLAHRWTDWTDLDVEAEQEMPIPEAPVLKSLTLDGIHPTQISPLTSASLTTLRFGENPGRHPAWNTVLLSELLQCTPNVEEMHFEGNTKFHITAAQYRWTHRLHCPNLRLLTVIHVDDPFLRELILYLHAPVLHTVRLSTPMRGLRHWDRSGLARWGTHPHPSVRELVVYHLQDEPGGWWEPQDIDFKKLLVVAFPHIESLEIGTATTRDLYPWGMDEDVSSRRFWPNLEKLKIHRALTASARPDDGVKEALGFVMRRKRIPDCRTIEDLSIDTTEVSGKPEVEQAVEGLRREVQNVSFGIVEMTPWM